MIRTSRGLTLAEALVSAAILAVSLLGIASMFPTAMENMDEAGSQTRGFSLAQGMVERIRGTTTFNDLLLYNGQSTAQANFTTASAAVNARLTTWKQAVEQVPGSGISGGTGVVTVTATGTTPARLATITVTVQWPNKRGISAVLITQVSET